MKRNTLLALLLIETTIIILGLIRYSAGNFKDTESSQESLENSSYIYDFFAVETGEKELLREFSPDGIYGLTIRELGAPDFPFGDDHLEITLFEVIPEDERPRVQYRASFKADVASDGGRAGYEVKWLEDGVQIALSGSEQPTAYYVMPFKAVDD